MLDAEEPAERRDDLVSASVVVVVEADDEPKRSRSGAVSRAMRVVAPIRVKRGRSSRTLRRAGPLADMMSSAKSSIAG